jgi:hypothetical protein
MINPRQEIDSRLFKASKDVMGTVHGVALKKQVVFPLHRLQPGAAG